MLEITIGATDRMVLANSNLFNEKNVIDFSMLLTYGKIKDIEKLEYKKVALAEFNPKEEYERLVSKVKNYDEVRIWYSSRDSEDTNTFYYLVNYLSDKNKTIYSCDVNNGYAFSVGCYTSDEIEPLLNNTKLLTKEEVNKISKEWQQLVNENADVRFVEDKKLVSHNFEYLDNKIIEVLSTYEEPVKYFSFVGKLMGSGVCNMFADIFYMARIDYLIETGKIEIVEIKEEVNGIGELRKYKYIKVK